GLLGPNGAGKTTLIHTLLGFHPTAAGTAQIFGYDILDQAKQIRSLVGYMPERDAFIAKMSAVHFVRLMGELSGLPSEAALERAHEALFYVGLGEARYRRLETYSLGMKQLANLAPAILHARPGTAFSGRAAERARSPRAPAHDQVDPRDSRQRPRAHRPLVAPAARRRRV